MKKPIYEKLDDVPQADRDENNYELNQHAGSPHYGKYVLILDPTHPVMVKNTELVQKENTRETEKTTAVNAAVAAAVTPLQADVNRLTGELNVAKSQNGLPAGQVAVPADSLVALNNYKTLGEFDAVKAKVEEHGTLKEQTEAANRKTVYTEIAEAKGMDVEVLTDLAEESKLFPNIEIKKSTDAKGVTTTDYFVKGKDEKGTDTSTAIEVFAKSDDKFKRFEKSLFLSETQRKKVVIPNQKHGESAVESAAGKSYVNRNYKRPDKKDKE